jgi:biopolymer transport protein ExbB/TolQ
MFALILIVLVGLGIALFSQQNNQAVPLVIGNFFFPAVPVYMIVIFSLLFGLFVAWILSVMDFFSHSLLLRRKDGVINSAEKRVTELEDRVHKLETENAELRGAERIDRSHVPAAHDVENSHRNFFEQMRDRFAQSRREGALS